MKDARPQEQEGKAAPAQEKPCPAETTKSYNSSNRTRDLFTDDGTVAVDYCPFSIFN